MGGVEQGEYRDAAQFPKGGRELGRGAGDNFFDSLLVAVAGFELSVFADL